MTYDQLVPKVDSLKEEAFKISMVYEVLVNQEELETFNSDDQLIYFLNDSLRILYLDKSGSVFEENAISTKSQDLLYQSKNKRPLHQNELWFYNSNKELNNELEKVLNGKILDSLYLKIFVNEHKASKLFVFRRPPNENTFSFTDAYCLTKSSNGELFSRHYQKGRKNLLIVNNSGDTLPTLNITSSSSDLYFTPMNIFLFEYFTPSWWVNQLKLFSIRNKRTFIFSKSTGEIIIEKRDFEK